MIKIINGEDGLEYTWQNDFPKTTPCCRCKEGKARIGFIYYEGDPINMSDEFICKLHKNIKNKLWLHDVCAVAIYFCEKCLEPTALYNQA